MSSNPSENKDVNRLIGARVRAAREAAGLSQRELAKKLGVSYNKIHTLEQGITRMLVSDLIEIADALDISPWKLLWDVIEPPDLRSFLANEYRDLMSETGVVIEEMIASLKWIERRWRVKLRMFYRPIYYFHPQNEPIEFVEEWENPTLEGEKRYLYIQKRGDEYIGYFFEAEIVPARSPEDYDTPMPSDKQKWENERQLRQFLEENGYCWQLYPIKIHHGDYCSPEHQAVIESQRRAVEGMKDMKVPLK